VQALTQQQPALSMTSREIAELTGKELSNVHRDIRSMLAELYGAEHLEKVIPEYHRNRHAEFIRENAGVILDAIAGHDSKWNHEDGRGFSWERDSRGYVTLFRLDYTHTMTLVAGYNVKLRKRIIDRWQELESTAVNTSFVIPQTLPDALRLAADLAEENSEVKAKLEQAAPKAEVYDRIANASGMLTLRDAAKTLQVAERKFIGWLEETGWLYRNAQKQARAYSEPIKQGLLAHKTDVFFDSRYGLERVQEAVRVTPKGLTVLAQRAKAVFPATLH